MSNARGQAGRPPMTKADNRLIRTMLFIFLDFFVALFSVPLAVILLLLFLVIRLAR